MKANFEPYCHIPAEVVAANLASCRARNLPGPVTAKRGPLAVVGGAPSVLKHIETLRDWPGDVWASGSAYAWCRDNGIKAAFFYIDPDPQPIDCAGAEKAIIATCVAPAVIDALGSAEIIAFDLYAGPEMSNHGVTTITSAPLLALNMGYREVVFFGADSSYEGDTHAYQNTLRQSFAVVRVGDEAFVTDAELLMQGELLAHVIRAYPTLFRERCGGLLGALVKDLDYDITFYSDLRKAA